MITIGRRQRGCPPILATRPPTFPESRAGGCDHSGPEVECALDAWVEAGHSSVDRLASYRRLLAALRSEPA